MAVERDVEEERLARIEQILADLQREVDRFHAFSGRAAQEEALLRLRDAVADLRRARILSERQRGRRHTQRRAKR